MESRAAFWDRRILRWENARYSGLALASPFAWSVRSRMRLAAGLLRGELNSCSSVLDLGCGSGVLARAILDQPWRRYRGVDLSAVAVAAARLRYERYRGRITFECGDAATISRAGSDLAVFLGLLDWLTPAQSRELFAKREERYLLFSFTEPGGFFSGIYGRYRSATDSEYRPRSLDEATISGWMSLAGYRPVKLLRSPFLGPACLVVAAQR